MYLFQGPPNIRKHHGRLKRDDHHDSCSCWCAPRGSCCWTLTSWYIVGLVNHPFLALNCTCFFWPTFKTADGVSLCFRALLMGWVGGFNMCFNEFVWPFFSRSAAKTMVNVGPMNPRTMPRGPPNQSTCTTWGWLGNHTSDGWEAHPLLRHFQVHEDVPFQRVLQVGDKDQTRLLWMCDVVWIYIAKGAPLTVSLATEFGVARS